MTRMFVLLAVIAAGLVAVNSAAAKDQRPWWLNSNQHGYYCDRGQQADRNTVAGPFETKADCEAAIPPVVPPPCNEDECPPPPPPVATVTVEPPHDSGSFLCYAIGGDAYTAADKATALALEQAGYWLPTALVGDGSTQVGAYHLVCRAPVTGSSTGPFADTGQLYADNNGDVLDYNSADSTDWVGVYPIGAQAGVFIGALVHLS